MDETALQAVIAAEIEDAVSFIDQDIAPDRAAAVDYYFGRPFGNEEEGRSSVVSRDVHDTISAIEPSIMRIFFAPESVVEFAPHGSEDVDQAEQATDYCNYVFTRDNDGFGIMLAVVRNALREKVGIVKYYWDSSVEVTTTRYTGLDEMSLGMLLEDLEKALEVEITDKQEDDNGLTIELKLKRKTDRVRIEALPPEEFIISRRAKSIEEASFCGHRTMKTVSELVAMGYERELVESLSGDSDSLQANEERLVRNPSQMGLGTVQGDDSQRLVLYVEGYALIDADDDGIAELRKICCLGPNYKVAHNEPANHRPFADFQCDPEPHTFFGQSVADKTMDIQRVKSNVWRASLDSLTQSIFPRTVVVDNDGRMEDAQNPEVGALLRAKTPTGYVNLSTPFVGEQAFPMLTYMDSVRENRTGMSKVSMGLDAEALQNTTATAAEGQFSRSQDRIDLIARVMASGLGKLFRGVLRLVAENQRKPRMVKLCNKWTPVDPRAWRIDMDVICNVGLGGGTDAAKAGLLNMVLAKQEQAIAEFGLDNPLCGIEEYRNTLVKVLELGGFKNPGAFFKELPRDDHGKVALPPQPPQPDPKMVEIQGKMQLEQGKAQIQAQSDATKAQNDYELRQMELATTTQMKREEMAQTLQLKREQLEAELELKRQQLVAELELKRELGMANAQVAHETGMAKAQASTSTSDVEPGGEPG